MGFEHRPDPVLIVLSISNLHEHELISKAFLAYRCIQKVSEEASSVGKLVRRNGLVDNGGVHFGVNFATAEHLRLGWGGLY